MAARVNSRFIIIMLAIVSVTAGSVAALWIWQARGNVDRIVQQAEELYEQGQYRQATTLYGRAIRRDPGNMEWVRGMEKSVLAQRPETSDAARQLYEQWMATLRLGAEYQANDPDAQLRLIDELHDSARMVARFAGEPGQRRMWHEVANAADHMLVRVPEEESRRAYGLLYRGMANLNQRRGLSEQDLRRAEQDIVDFLEAMPNHDRGWASHANGQMLLEEHARVAGDPRRLAERRQRLADVMHEARAAVPDGPEVSVAYVRYLTRPHLLPAGVQPPTREQVEAALNTMVSAVSRVSDTGHRSGQWLVLDAIELLLDFGGPAGLSTATRLVEEHLSRDDGAIAHRFTLATLNVRTGEYVRAQSIVEEILATGPLPVGIMSQIQPAVQTAAAGLLSEIEYRRWIAAQDDREHVAAMRKAVERLDRFVSDSERDPRMVRAVGKLALMEGRLPDAAARFEQLIREGNEDAEILFASAHCLRLLGEIGLAHERITAAGERGRLSPAALMLKAEIELTLGRLEAAEDTMRAYMAAIPATDDAAAETGSRMLRTIAARKQGVTPGDGDAVEAALHHAQTVLGGERGTQGLEAARAVLVAALEGHPNDVRLLGTLASIEMNAGHTETAMAYLNRALEIAPEHPILRQLAIVARSGDPIDAAMEFFGEVENEVDRNAAVLRAMASLRAQDLMRAEVARRSGLVTEADQEEYEEATARAERAARIVADAAARLREIAPDHAVLIDHDFNEAIARRDWALAGQIVQRAKRSNADQMNGLLYEGRFELERRPARPEHAVRAFQSATELRPFSNTAWRGLAIAYQHAGNFREAIRAFEQAYAINPNDAQTIRGYLALLIQVGDRARAMRVSRDAFRALPADHDLRELWLGLEAEHNNLGVAIDRRYDIYRANPGDRTNAMRLALLLARAQPRYDLLRTGDGQPLYTERQWNQLRVSEQRRILDEQGRTWQAAAIRIVDELFARDAAQAPAGALPDLELVALRAEVLRARGDTSGGEKVLEEHAARVIAAADPATSVSRALLALANYQVESGMLPEAMATMGRAQEVQSPTAREGDLAMADFLFGRGQFEQAMSLYEDVQRVAPRRATELRIVECALNLRQFDRAEAILANLTPARGPAASPTTLGEAESTGDFMARMLVAMIARGRSEDLHLRGQTADAQRQFERFEAAVNEAERLSPANPMPHILRAQAKIAEFRRTRQRVALEDAMAALDRAEAVRAGDLQTSLTRVEVHREGGNTRAAIGELNRILERTPSNIQARRMVAQLHLDGGNIPAAIEAVERAIELFPTVPAWYEMLGSIYMSPEAGSRASRAAASAAYLKAYEHSQSPGMLSRAISALVAQGVGRAEDKPDFAAALQILQRENAVIEREPSIEAILAYVLIGTGRESDGRHRLARSYGRLREQISTGARHVSDIGSWYQAANAAMRSMTTSQIEAMVRDAGPGLPDQFDLLWLARRESEGGPRAIPAVVDLLRRAADAPGVDQDFRLGVIFEMSGHQIGMGEYSAAAAALAEVVAAVPNNWVARNNLAFIKADRMGQPAAALPHAQRALELRPHEPSVLDTVGWVYFKLGEYARAEDHLQRSLNLQETARTQVHMAEVLIATRRFDAALTRLRRAAELNPDTQTQADIDRLTDDVRTKRASA